MQEYISRKTDNKIIKKSNHLRQIKAVAQSTGQLKKGHNLAKKR